MSSSLEAVSVAWFSHQGKRPRRFRYRCRGELCLWRSRSDQRRACPPRGRNQPAKEEMGVEDSPTQYYLDHTSPLAPESPV